MDSAELARQYNIIENAILFAEGEGMLRDPSNPDWLRNSADCGDALDALQYMYDQAT